MREKMGRSCGTCAMATASLIPEPSSPATVQPSTPVTDPPLAWTQHSGTRRPRFQHLNFRGNRGFPACTLACRNTRRLARIVKWLIKMRRPRLRGASCCCLRAYDSRPVGSEWPLSPWRMTQRTLLIASRGEVMQSKFFPEPGS